MSVIRDRRAEIRGQGSEAQLRIKTHGN